MKKYFFLISALLICTLSIGQNRYSTISTSEYKPMSYEEIMSVPQALQKKYEVNQEYLYSLKKWILELKAQIKDNNFVSRLNGQYEVLTSMENDDLARATKSLKQREMEIREIVSEYNIFVTKENEKTSSNENRNSPTNSPKDYAQLGVQNYQNKEYAKAITSFSKHLETDKNNTDVMFFRALSKSELGDIYGAIDDYEKIIELNSNYPMQYAKLATVYNNKAYCLTKQKKYKEALPFVEKALSMDETEWFIWDTRGEIYYNLGDYNKSIKDLTKAIKIKENENSYYFRGLAFIKLGQKEKSCKDLSKAGELGNELAYQKIKENCN
jgi:tetratricopeptide (TPR) repeat protein